jgi:tetratricopeptide (TPR) repeat protein
MGIGAGFAAERGIAKQFVIPPGSDSTLLAIDMFSGGRRGGTEVPNNDELRRRFKLMSQRGYSQLACLGVFMAATYGKVDPGLMDEAMKVVQDAKDPSPLLLYVLERPYAGRGTSPTDQTTRAALNKYVAQVAQLTFRRLPLAHLRQSESSNAVFTALGKELAPRDLLDFLQKSMPAVEAPPDLRADYRKLSPPLTFPPPCLPGVNPNTLLLLTKSADRPPAILSSGRFDTLVPEIKDPLLKVLVAAACFPPEQVDSLVKEMLGQGEPTAAELILAAAWQNSQGKRAQAAATLARTRACPLSLLDRQYVEGWIIACAAAQSDDRKLADLAKSAALRLSFAPLSSNDRQTLADVMWTLDMEGQARDSERLTAGFIPNLSQTVTMAGLSDDKIRQLLRDHRADQAARALARAFALRVAPVLQMSSESQMSPQAYEADQVISRAQQFNLSEAVLKELNRRAEASPAWGRLVYARALERSGKLAEARQQYQAVLAAQPDHYYANFAMARLSAPDGGEGVTISAVTAWKYLKQAGRNDPEKIAKLLLDLSSGGNGFEATMRYGEISLEALQECPDLLATRRPWLTTILDRVGNQMYCRRGFNLPSLFNPIPDPNLREETRQSPEYQANLKERRDMYLRLSEAALKSPATCEQAFVGRAMLLGDTPAVLAQLSTEAKVVILARNELPGSSSPYYPYYRSADTASLVLVRSAAVNKTTAELEAFVKTLDPARYKRTQAEIADLRTLYDSPPEAFLEAARKFVAIRTMANGGFARRMPVVIAAWKDLGIGSSLTPLILEQMRSADPNAVAEWARGVGPNAASEWARTVLKKQGEKALVELLNQVAEVYLGTAGGTERPAAPAVAAPSRPAPVPPVASPRGYLGELGVSMYIPLLQDLARDKDLATCVLATACRYPVLFEQSRIGVSSSEALDDGTLIKAIGQLRGDWEFIRRSPLVAACQDFRACRFEQENISVLELVVTDARRGVKGVNPENYDYRFADRYDRKPQPILANLKELQPQTFGSTLLQLLIDNPTQQKVYAFLGEHLEEIRQASPRQQRDLIVSVDQTLQRINAAASGPLTGLAVAYAAHARGVLRTEAAAAAQRFLLEQRTFDHGRGFDSRNYLTRAANLVALASEVDTSQAQAIFDHAIKQVKTMGPEVLRQEFHEGGPEQALLNSILQQSGSLESMPFICALGRRLEAGGSAYANVARTYEGTLAKLLVVPPDAPLQPRGRRLIDALTALDAKMSSQPLPGLSVGVARAAREMTAPELSLVIAELSTPEHAKSALLAEAKVHLELLRDRKTGDVKQAVSLPDSFIAFYRQMLLDNSTAPAWRQGAYLWLRNEFPSRMQDQNSPSRTPPSPLAPLDLARLRELSPEAAGLTATIQDVNEYMLLQLSADLNETPVTSEWKEAAVPVCAAWRKIVSSRTEGAGSGEDRTRRIVPWATFLRTHLKLGGREEAEALLTASNLHLARSPLIYLVLLDSPWPELLGQTLEANWKDLEPMPQMDRSDFSFIMTPELRKQADQALGRMKEGDLRRLAAALYAAFPVKRMPTPESGDNYARLAPQDGLLKLAEELRQAKWDDPAARLKAIDYLLVGDLLPKLRQELCQWGDALEPKQVEEASGNYERAKRYAQYICALLEKGRFEDARKAVNTAQALAAERSKGQRWPELVSFALKGHISGDFNGQAQVGAALPWGCTAGQYLELTQGLVKTKDYWSQELISTVCSLYYLAGREAELPAWVGSVTDGQNQQAMICVGTFDQAARSAKAEDRAAIVRQFKATLNFEPQKGQNGQNGRKRGLGDYLGDSSFPQRYPALQAAIADSVREEAQTRLKALGHEPADKAGYDQIVSDCVAVRNSEAAAEVCRQWVKEMPSPEAYGRLSTQLQNVHKNAEAAEACLEGARLAGPKQGERYLRAIDIYRTVPDLPKALEVCQEALKTVAETDQGPLYRQQGEIYLKLDKPDLALAAFRKAVEMSQGQNKAFALSQIATFCKQAGKYDEALQACTAAAAAAPDLPLAKDQYLMMGEISELQQKWDQAILYYRKAMEGYRDDANRRACLTKIAQVCGKGKCYDLGLAVIEEGLAALERQPGQMSEPLGLWRQAKAQILFEQGKLVEARRLAQSILDDDKNYGLVVADARKLIGQIEESLLDQARGDKP